MPVSKLCLVNTPRTNPLAATSTTIKRYIIIALYKKYVNKIGYYFRSLSSSPLFSNYPVMVSKKMSSASLPAKRVFRIYLSVYISYSAFL